MGISSSRPIQPNHVQVVDGNECPENGARNIPVTQRATSAIGTTFSGCVSALWNLLVSVKNIVAWPIKTAWYYTADDYKAYIRDKGQKLRATIQSYIDRKDVYLNRAEIARLSDYFKEDRIITDQIRADLKKLPQAAREAINKSILKDEPETDQAMRKLRDQLNEQLAAKKDLRDSLASTAVAQTDTPRVAAPHAAALAPPGPLSQNAVAGPSDRLAQLMLEKQRIDAQIAALSAEHAEGMDD